MLEYPTISKRKPEFPDYLNFQTLRDIGISHLQTLSGKIWTDYNLHDPGVTILEVLCYAVTDLGYRNNLDIKDLLALTSQQRENNFFTPDEILTCNPVTSLDLRKRLIDIPGVRNAWIEKFTEVDAKEKTAEITEESPQKISTYHPPIYIDYANSQLQPNPPNGYTENSAPRLHPRGLYTVYVDLDREYRKNACGQIYNSWSDILDSVKAVLCSHRNLCEDIYDIVVLGAEEIALCSDIELEADADAEDVLVEIYVKIQDFLSPHLKFYTLQELLDKGKNIEEIFAGRPSVKEKNLEQNSVEEQAIAAIDYASHGFIDTDELNEFTQPEVIYTSDLYQEILKIPGVLAVRRLSIANFINGLAQSQSPWHLKLTKGYSPVLGIEQSKITLFKGVLPISPDGNEVKRRYYEQQAAHIKVLRQDNELDLSVPQGSYYDLADHYSIQHDFPLTYGIGEDGLPETAKELRKAQARQLKGYLVFFDQLLANYLAQLAHVRDLFSWEVDESRNQDKSYSYFIQELDFPDQKAIFGEGGKYLEAIQEKPEMYRDRRNRFLDHLLGRFAESFADYVVINYQIIQERRDQVKDEIEIIHDKAQFLQDYPVLSRDRFRAFNYCNYRQVWDTENVSGLQKRVSRLLGFEDFRRRNLCHYQVDKVSGGFISFGISCGDENQSLISLQTYSNQKAAQADIEKFLLFALHENFYQRLTYSYFYHYGLEVEAVNGDEIVIARYEQDFLSKAERINKLNSLINQLLNLFNLEENSAREEIIATSTISREDIIKIIHQKKENLYYFQLEIPDNSSQTSELIKFEGVQRYFSEGLARKAAIAILKQITNRQNYYAILFRQDNSAERETLNPSDETRFTHYGYALVDNEGKVLGESSEHFSKEEERETALQRWLNCLKFDPNKFQESDERFLQVEEVTGETSGYRFRLIDREEVELLQGFQLCENENIARDRFYQDVLSVLFEPGAIEPTRSNEGFGFRVLSKPRVRDIFRRNQRNVVAISPQLYASERERDAAIEHLFLLVRTAHFNITWTGLENSSNPNYIGRIYDQNRNILLEASQRYPTPERAWEQGNILMELAGEQAEFTQNGEADGKNFRLIDPETAQNGDNSESHQKVSKLYGWELTNRGKDKILATRYYTSKEERNKSIQELQKLVNDEGFHLLEHILLRPRTTSDNFLPVCVHTDDGTREELTQLTYQDPYSFWITIILPYWSERFRNIDFRRFVERTLRLETPAHIALKIAWVNVQQMRELELAYQSWLQELAWETANSSTCNLSGTLNNLLTIISQLRNIYPQGILYDTQVASKEQPIILNQTALGTASE
ncbi:hypothetical protein [Calothrix sp. 336/3]|uniref:hypothetical protein n=1 Tax=Calothrix sp. 336/3 TaxID=1337936 RepID=UPI0004E444B3|nr:hypothetical protein [Calothrix sp. 336/3]AKG21577.1 hypothetical protein IJ00_10085 [Calothrix sp. 336/3]